MPKMRIDKLISKESGESRNDCKKKIRKNGVLINDEVIKDPGKIIDTDSDAIIFDNKEIHHKEFLYLMLNKPAGLVSAVTDERDPTVIAYVSERFPRKNLFPAGRLDKDTEGLLLLTDDGQLAHNLLNPKKHVDKIYYLEISGKLNKEKIALIQEGIMLDDGYQTKPAKLEIVGETPLKSELLMTISEGKFHQVKRMIKAAGQEVQYLKRIQIGSLRLDPELAIGDYRELTSEELILLKGESL